MFDHIENTIRDLKEVEIPLSRKQNLNQLRDFVQDRKDHSQIINLIFICTHNSRRSHLSQVWAQTMAAYFKLSNLFCYSGGTEATALFPAAAEALVAAGFRMETLSNGKNPIHSIRFDQASPSIIGFSKKYDHLFNPTQDFAAILTCSSADNDCPFIPGALRRIALPYQDPKSSDGSPEQEEVYFSRSLEIAAELYYVFSQIQ
ncbi:arsenate-mycothiol transferase ArsC [Nonlabens xiamenensis]|uniref:arsenate-mycothiol transferase ArsC n=1 Tax=Nonlabens xiamenensis TaxID=2341043 RepID=UPI000F6127A9|nr:protein-tyrosine-phosphatase [Nonlabens xiamenensis]